MSYNLSLLLPGCPTCGAAPGDVLGGLNVTRNVSRIVDLCISSGRPDLKAKTEGFSGSTADYSWCRLHGWTGAELVPVLEAAIAAADDPGRRAEFVALEPSNGWGSLVHVREAFALLLACCREHPTAACEVRG